MSFASVGDIVFGDLLSEVGMKPRWEIYRGYFYAISAAIAFLMSDIITPAPTVDCLPRVGDSNATIKAMDCTEGNSWVNSYCANQLPWWLAYIGFFAGSFTVLIFLASNWWLQSTNVISCFRTFAKIESMMNTDLHMTVGELKSKVFRPDKVKDNEMLSKLTDTLFLLWNIETKSGIEKIYFVRNGILCVLYIGFVAATFSFVGFLGGHDEYFECSISEQTHVIILESGSKIFVCTHGIARKTIFLMVIFGLCLFLQLLAVIIGWVITYSAINRNDKDFEKAWGKYSKIVSYARFVKVFWENSSPSTSNKLWKFISYVCCEDALHYYVRPDKKKRRISRLEDDETYRDLLVRIGSNPFVYKTVMWVHKMREFSPVSEEYKILLRGFDHLRSKNHRVMLPEIPDELMPRMVRARHYELLVDLLSILWVSQNEEFGKMEGLHGVNFNEIDRDGRSILQYAFKSVKGEFPRFRAVLQLLWNVKFEGRLFVHNKTKSLLAEQILTIQTTDPSPGEELGPVGKRQSAMLLDLIRKSESAHCDRISAERNILGPNVETLDNFSRQMNGFLEQPLHAFSDKMTRKLDGHFSRLQISEWTGTATEIAVFLHRNAMWKSLVELLNSFVKPNAGDKNIPVPLQCGVLDFDLSAEPDHPPVNATVLFHALQKSQHRERYRFTAIRHILSCSDFGNARVWDEEGNSYGVLDFIEKQGLVREDEMELKRLFNPGQYGAEISSPQQVQHHVNSDGYSQSEKSVTELLNGKHVLAQRAHQAWASGMRIVTASSRRIVKIHHFVKSERREMHNMKLWMKT